MKVICPNCKKEQKISWKITGFGLKTMNIELECVRCKSPMNIVVTFLDGNKHKDEVKSAKADYIL